MTSQKPKITQAANNKAASFAGNNVKVQKVALNQQTKVAQTVSKTPAAMPPRHEAIHATVPAPQPKITGQRSPNVQVQETLKSDHATTGHLGDQQVKLIPPKAKPLSTTNAGTDLTKNYNSDSGAFHYVGNITSTTSAKTGNTVNVAATATEMGQSQTKAPIPHPQARHTLFDDNKKRK